MDTVEATIIGLARERSQALVSGDRQALRRLLADEFRYVNASGAVLDKQAYLLAYVGAAEIRWTAQDLDEPIVQVHGDAAILACRVHDRGWFGDEPFDGWYRSLFVWVLRQGEWRCAAGQTTAIAATDEA